MLAGRMAGLLDVVTHLPRALWSKEDAQAHDQRFWEQDLAALERNTLVIFDLGFLNFTRVDQLTEAGSWFITRSKANTGYQVEKVLRKEAMLHDQLVWVGSGATSRCGHLLRLVGGSTTASGIAT